MRLSMHTVKTPTWTQSAYGEPVAAYGTARTVAMFIGWNSMINQDLNDSLYREYDFVGLTRESVSADELVDDTYVVGHVEAGRWNRVFMNYAKGKDRTYGSSE